MQNKNLEMVGGLALLYVYCECIIRSLLRYLLLVLMY